MNKTVQIPPDIFKSYDIRGIVDKEINESIAELIGVAAVAALGATKLAVGRDMREHGPRLMAALIRGVTGAGADVISIGQCSTPMSYFAAATLDVDGALMVTASHNPGQYNGFKFSKRGGQPMGMGTGLERVRDLVVSGEAANLISSESRGSVEEINLLDSWCTHLKQYLPHVRPLKIVIDCGNGVTGPVIHELLKHVDPEGKLEIIWLFDRPDPLTLVNLRYLQGAVLASGADYGVAFDGDGDRVAFVDQTGRFVGCDLMTALFAGDILAEPQNRGKNVLYDLRSSRVAKEAIEAAGGVAEMCRVGHSHVKAAMRGKRQGAVLDPSVKGDIVFGGELSGHFYFRDCFMIDTGERAFLLALKIMTESSEPLGERIAPLRRYYHSGEINFRLPDHQAMQEVLDAVQQKYSDHRIFKLDGVSVEGDSWWLNVRLSNTEPVVRLTAESFVSRDKMQEIVSEVEEIVRSKGGTIKA
jgi:phosphomannomutase